MCSEIVEWGRENEEGMPRRVSSHAGARRWIYWKPPFLINAWVPNYYPHPPWKMTPPPSQKTVDLYQGFHVLQGGGHDWVVLVNKIIKQWALLRVELQAVEACLGSPWDAWRCFQSLNERPSKKLNVSFGTTHLVVDWRLQRLNVEMFQISMFRSTAIFIHMLI